MVDPEPSLATRGGCHACELEESKGQSGNDQSAKERNEQKARKGRKNISAGRTVITMHETRSN